MQIGFSNTNANENTFDFFQMQMHMQIYTLQKYLKYFSNCLDCISLPYPLSISGFCMFGFGVDVLFIVIPFKITLH